MMSEFNTLINKKDVDKKFEPMFLKSLYFVLTFYAIHDRI